MTKQLKQTTGRHTAAKRAVPPAPVVPLAVTARRVTLAAGIALLSSTALSGPALAAPVTWIGTTGFRDVAANWNPGVPAAADQMTINSETITHRTGTSTINSLNIAETLIVNNNSSFGVGNTFNARAHASGTGLIKGGVTQNGAVSAQASGGVKGVNFGSVTISYRSDGTNIDPTITSQAANTQTIKVRASGYTLASSGTVGPITFANVLRISMQERFLKITNQGALGDLYQEGLNAGLGAFTGPDSGKFTVSGTVTNLGPGPGTTPR